MCGQSIIFDLTSYDEAIYKMSPYPANIFYPENVMCSIYSNAFQKAFTIEANTVNPDQVCPNVVFVV